MLLENIQLIDKLPFAFAFSNVAEEDFHYHNEMEMLLVLKGKTKCKIHNVLYTLNEGDILIIDTQDMHRIFDSSPDILMLDMYVDLQFYTDLYPDIDYMIFACEDYSKTSSLKYQDLQKKVSVLKHHMAKTALACINNKDDFSLHMDCIDNLIFTLVNQFQGFFIEDYKFKADTGSPSDIDLNRLYKIIKYIYLNYDKKITLEDLSDIVFLNPYYVSHLIKNTSGLSFQNFLNYIRLEYAEKLLVNSPLNLTQISQACGFSSLSYFNKCFKTWYKVTPAQYRKQLVRHERRYHRSYPREKAISLLEKYLLASHQERNRELIAKYSHHIFIPVKKDFKAGRSLKKQFPLRILLSKDEDITMFNYRRNEIQKLIPASILLDYQHLIKPRKRTESINLIHTISSLGFPVEIFNSGADLELQIKNMVKSMNISVLNANCKIKSFDSKDGKNLYYTAASAFNDLYKNTGSAIELSGASIALFTPEGLLTPYYYIYSTLSQMDGLITEQRDQYLIVRNDKAIYIIIFHKDRDSKLKVHIHINDIFGNYIIARKSFARDHNCYDLLKYLDCPAALTNNMKTYINDYTKGMINLCFVDATGSHDMNFDMDPCSIMFIEISDLL